VTETTTHPKIIKNKQMRNLLGVIVFFVVMCLAIYSLFANYAPEPPVLQDNKDKEATLHFETPLAQVDSKSLWIEHAQNQLEQATKTTQALNQQLQLLQQSKDSALPVNKLDI
jgi:hypothetical protein